MSKTKPLPTEPQLSWLDGFNAALAKVRQAQEDSYSAVVGLKRRPVRENMAPFWWAVRDLLAALMQRPMPGHLGKIESYARDISEALISVFESAVEYDSRAYLRTRKKDYLVGLIDSLDEFVANCGKPKAVRFETPLQLFKQGVSGPQIVKMTGITLEAIDAYRVDPIANPLPPGTPPPQPEVKPIVTVNGELFALVRRVTDLAVQVSELPDFTEADSTGCDESLQDAQQSHLQAIRALQSC